ncbi:MAG: STAS domain-containing protein [Coriobacteriia bacterium]|nr:STAS domain-containing protein [Coriobacteriia bacterium]
MEIIKKLEGTRLSVTLSGELNTVTAPELEANLAEDLQTIDEIVFDMEDLSYITSSGLRVLLVCQQELEERGGVTIRSASSVIREVIEVTGFDSILTLE